MSVFLGLIAILKIDDAVDLIVRLSDISTFISGSHDIFGFKLKSALIFALYFQLIFIFLYKQESFFKIFKTYLCSLITLLLGFLSATFLFFLKAPNYITDGSWFQRNTHNLFIETCIFGFIFLMLFSYILGHLKNWTTKVATNQDIHL